MTDRIIGNPDRSAISIEESKTIFLVNKGGDPVTADQLAQAEKVKKHQTRLVISETITKPVNK